MNGWQADLDIRTAGIPQEEDRPTCYAGAVNYKGAKSFGGTYVQYPPFTAVHIDNVADSAAQSGSIEVTLEQLGEWNPDYMFLNAGNMELMQKDYASNQAFFDNLRHSRPVTSTPAFVQHERHQHRDRHLRCLLQRRNRISRRVLGR